MICFVASWNKVSQTQRDMLADVLYQISGIVRDNATCMEMILKIEIPAERNEDY